MLQAKKESSSGRDRPLILPRSTPFEMGKYQASLYLSYGILLTASELSLLLECISKDLTLWGSGILLPQEKIEITRNTLVEIYQKFLFNSDAALLSKEEKAALSSVLTSDPSAISLRELAADKWQVVYNLPCVQLSRFQFRYDEKLHRFFKQSFSGDTVFWGLELRFPQLFIDPITSKVIKVLKTPYPNTLLWKEIQGWVRNHTCPVWFEVEREKRVAPFRIGKSAFDLGEEIIKRYKPALTLMRPA